MRWFLADLEMHPFGQGWHCGSAGRWGPAGFAEPDDLEDFGVSGGD